MNSTREKENNDGKGGGGPSSTRARTAGGQASRGALPKRWSGSPDLRLSGLKRGLLTLTSTITNIFLLVLVVFR